MMEGPTIDQPVVRVHTKPCGGSLFKVGPSRWECRCGGLRLTLGPVGQHLVPAPDLPVTSAAPEEASADE